MKHFTTSLKMLGFMSFLTGVIYPLLITLLSQTFFKPEASGSLVLKNGEIVGSKLIAQKFESPRYFWPRPSAIDYNPLPSGGSNLGPLSLDLKTKLEERKAKLGSDIPSDLLYASASGLDPHISIAAAMFQIPRVASARGMDPEQLKSIVEKSIEKRQLEILGEPRVNVLALNLFLDEPER